MTIMYRDYDGAWSMPALALTSATNNSHWVGAIAIRPTTGYGLNAPTLLLGPANDFGTANTAHQPPGTPNASTTPPCLMIAAHTFNDNVTSSTFTWTQASATINNVTERCDGGTATGNDVSGKIHTADKTISAGNGNLFTLNLTLSASSQGTTSIVQQTESLLPSPPASTLTDDFTTLNTSTNWNVGGTVTPTVSSGRLNLTYNGNGIGTQAGSIETKAAYDLTNSAMSIRLVDAGTQSPSENRSAQIYVRNPDWTRWLTTFVSNGSISFRYWNGSTNSDTSITYNPATHRYLRIRESGGTVYWDTSPDGLNWTNQRSLATPFDVSSVYMLVVADVWGTGTGGEVTKWDNFNCCPLVETLTDDFTTLDTATKWSVWGATPTISGGRLALDAISAYEGIFSQRTYDVTGSSASIRVAQPPNTGTGQTSVGLLLRPVVYSNSNEATIVVGYATGGGSGAHQLLMNERVGGVQNLTSITYDSTAHRYLRIREASGTTYWETSPDGVTWTSRKSKTTGFDMSNMYVTLLAGNDNSDPSPGTALIDDFNCCPLSETLTDDFASNTQWTLSSGTTISGGTLNIPADSAYSGNAYSVNRFDFTGSSLSAEITAVTGGTNPITWGPRLRLNPASNQNEIGAILSGGAIFLNRVIGGTFADSGTYPAYNATNHKWIRIRESGGTVYLDVSATGASGSWTQIDSLSSSTLDLTSVVPIFFAGTDAGTGTTMVVDNVNLAPTVTTPTNLFFPFFS